MPERLIGETLGRYRVEALAGSGGFAWVYRAFDPELEIPVALKVLKPQYAGDADFEARFRREASTAAKLRHPNIVSIFAVGKENGHVYFAMDYLPRGLADRLEAVPSLPEPTVVRAGLDVAKALAFAHREGVVHRDIKVDNILFDEHGNAVVADFGIARAVAAQVRHTATNMVVGTPQYFSPEQARGQEIDGRSDIYSLGVTLYRAATGRLPFDGEDWYSIARQHVEEPPQPPRSLNPALSADFEQLLLRCLAKKPQDRFPDADELAERLESLRHPTTEITTARTVVMSPFTTGAGRRANSGWARLVEDRARAVLVGSTAFRRRLPRRPSRRSSSPRPAARRSPSTAGSSARTGGRATRSSRDGTRSSVSSRARRSAAPRRGRRFR
jgi:serine/threonine protein kinase